MATYRLYWAPEGKHIATVEARDVKHARRQAPQPYRKALGEVYAVERLASRGVGIYAVAWWGDGSCTITSQVNGALVDRWEHGEWRGAVSGGLEAPDSVRAVAMSYRPG